MRISVSVMVSVPLWGVGARNRRAAGKSMVSGRHAGTAFSVSRAVRRIVTGSVPCAPFRVFPEPGESCGVNGNEYRRNERVCQIIIFSLRRSDFRAFTESEPCKRVPRPLYGAIWRIQEQVSVYGAIWRITQRAGAGGGTGGVRSSGGAVRASVSADAGGAHRSQVPGAVKQI